MKAFTTPGPGVQNLQAAQTPVPQIDADELLVRIHAIGVGIDDAYSVPEDAHYPYPIGMEAAGIIEQIGHTVTDHQVGQRIAFISSGQPKGGTWAEFAAVKSTSLIVPIPRNMDFNHAAAVPIAGNTVLKAFRALDVLPPGASLFIAGGSGAIGTFAIQLASRLGWRVVASSSAANHDYMHSLGAEKTVDYRDPSWPQQILDWMPGGVDAAMAIQPGTTANSLLVVKDQGSLVSVSGDPLDGDRGIRMHSIPSQQDECEALRLLMDEVASTVVHVELERVYPFDQAVDALEKVESRRARGKIVLSLV